MYFVYFDVFLTLSFIIDGSLFGRLSGAVRIHMRYIQACQVQNPHILTYRMFTCTHTEFGVPHIQSCTECSYSRVQNLMYTCVQGGGVSLTCSPVQNVHIHTYRNAHNTEVYHTLLFPWIAHAAVNTR